MFPGLGENIWPIALSVLIAALSLAAAWKESRRLLHDDNPALWPPFWLSTAFLMLVLAFGQATDLGHLIANVGRRQAVNNDWYERRRATQAIVVGLISATWIVSTLVAIWRVPERRRRYLPMALIVLSLICYGAIRVISLHQIDAVLYRRHLVGIEIGKVVEYTGLVVASIAAALHVLPLTAMSPSRATHDSTPVESR